jgi:hypothetical protein
MVLRGSILNPMTGRYAKQQDGFVDSFARQMSVSRRILWTIKKIGRS